MNEKAKLNKLDSVSSALRQLKPMVSKLLQSASLPDLIEAIFEFLNNDFNFKSTGFYFINPKNQKLELLLAHGLSEQERLEAESTAMDRHPGWVIKNKKTYISQSEIAQEGAGFQKRLNLVSRLYSPIIYRNICIGTIGIASDESNAFDENHIAFIEFLCEITAVAYENIMILKEIQESKERMDMAIESLKFGIWDWDFEKNILIWDDYMYSLYDHKKENFNGAYEAFEKTLHPDDIPRVKMELENCFNEKSNFRSEFKILTQNGEVRKISASAKCIYSPNGKILRLVGANWDVTDLRDNEIRLIQASKMSSLGEMSAGIAHEVNNPLCIIKANASRIKTAMSSENFDVEGIIKYINSIDKTVERIVKIIDGLRNFSREASDDSFEMTSLSNIINETLSLCAYRFEVEKVELKINSICDKAQIECRPSQIQQVLVNILSNALDALKDRELKWVEVSTVDLGDFISILITDSGDGIPPAIRNKVLNPFFTTKEIGKGTGLGLSISSGIINSHNGTLIIDETCLNTRFVITLPKNHLK